MTDREHQPKPAGGLSAVDRLVGHAPSPEAAYEMGAKGGPSVDAERIAFEAWMAGHCWPLGAIWDGTGYRSEFEQGAYVCPAAMLTRQLWAAWRDRAALTPNMEFTVTAKPLEWAETAPPGQWDDALYGFIITHDPEEDDDYKYHASWGEGPEDSFATLTEAQQWCQEQADALVRDWALVTPNAGINRRGTRPVE